MIDASVRDDFPILKQQPSLIYFDNACMTLRPTQVIEALSRYYTDFPACAGRSNHHLAKRVADEVAAARKVVSSFIGAKHTEEIIFTRNTTESLNLVAQSLGLGSGDVVVISGKEHNSNLVPWLKLKQDIGIVVRVVTNGDWSEAITHDVRLVSVVLTSNLDGTSHAIDEIVRLARGVGALIMVDGAQAVPHKRISVTEMDVDFMAFSGHKLCGPSGIGVLYGKRKQLEQLSPFLVGGDTVAQTTYDTYKMLPVPEKFEAGLQDYAGIIGMAAAMEYLAHIGMETIEQHELQLNKVLSQAVAAYDRVSIIGPQEARLRGGICSFTIDGADHHQVAMMLDQLGQVAVRSGQHCVHSWFAAHDISGSIRASVYFYNTLDEVEKFIETFDAVMRIV